MYVLGAWRITAISLYLTKEQTWKSLLRFLEKNDLNNN